MNATDWTEVYPGLDRALGLALLVCSLFGLPGNILSLLYFLHKKEARDLPTFLYRCICSVDICTGLLSLPLIVSLFSNRSPAWFQFYPFCVTWAILFILTQQISVFLVLLLSVSRTHTIVRPFYPISRRLVALILVGFLIFRVVHEACLNLFPKYFKIKYQYTSSAVYCYYYLEHPSWAVLDEIVSFLFIAVVPVVITVSFCVCVAHVLKANTHDGEEDRKRVTVTMSLFTAVSLICNAPLFVNYLIYIVDCNIIEYVYPSDIYKNSFMYNYSWPMSEVFFMALNSALNPMVYFLRMERLRTWTVDKFGFVKNFFRF